MTQSRSSQDRDAPTPTRRRVLMLGYNEAQILDIAGPMEIFARAKGADEQKAYRVELIAEKSGPLKTTSGIELLAMRDLADVTDAELEGLDTLLISGGDGIGPQLDNVALIDFVQRAASRARRVASVCSGSFLLAAAGLLDGRRAATHWGAIGWLKKLYPSVTVDEDAIYVRDGKFWSSAGITAGMDMALALVEEDLGREEALSIARQLVMFLMRPGGQSQFSPQLAAQGIEDERLAKVCRFIADHPAESLSVAQLAQVAGMSGRNFARRFAEETGTTPAQFVERVRLDVACQMLATRDMPLDMISMAAGFGPAERMRRSFIRHLGVTPHRYRERFSTAQRDSARPHFPETQKDGRHVTH